MTDAQTAKLAVEKLLVYAMDKLEMDPHDIFYARNTLLEMLKLDSPAETHIGCPLHRHEVPGLSFNDYQTEIMDVLTDYAVKSGLIKDFERIHFETRLFAAVSLLPGAVNKRFFALEEKEGITSATDWLFDYSKANNYIRVTDINKNIIWTHEGPKGGLVVTINLSKPEKSPEEIAAAAKMKKPNYPACMLCVDNVGYPGHISHPARQTLRVIPITLGGEQWGLQYSPYQYYREHCIALSYIHRPMKVDRACLERLLDFTELFPHYFMGSNAALPIVGGSILSHDHYQGGAKVLPIFKSKIKKTYDCKRFGDVKISVADWYNSVVRIESEDKAGALDAADYVLNKWFGYSDESVGIFAKTDAQHNAVTPIARNENGVYTVDMILRNNRTDDAHPFGIYHPAEYLHNIKKEGIGIIEVSGVFILPGRLKGELAEVRKYLTGESKFEYEAIKSGNLALHADMIKLLADQFGTANTNETAEKAVTDYVNHACEKILEATAVFKNTAVGQAAFDRFMLTL